MRSETGDQALGPQSDRLIRAVVVGLGEGMKEKLEQTIRNFPEIKKTTKPVRLDLDAETREIRYRVA